ncbi:hypothetical protein IAQ61_001660 [Plenodomus lingam]|uniref:RBR-type E3 ubiquitin transferase n=1 Tax=Leptosphaeria maculans (strain JN3 / isolate v23.1.3 / race Av1-4-5-6-7-8) TaxID=985895 RepID=M1ZJP4_LEPMJ|nr:hypothetical protein IAQ61_001660 [Plenodomus lingam]CCT61104.1 hypothetical protein [Plenodomus lingam JN3]
MAPTERTEVYDLLILVDATYSMYDYLESLKTSLPKVIAISSLTSSFERIGLLAYRDYSEAGRTRDGLLTWSGWHERSSEAHDTITAEQLMATAAILEPVGGGDYPEATKTGLAKAHALMREGATTIILLYTDAPPHCWMVAHKDHDSNYHAEQIALKLPKIYDGFGSQFVDWVSACNQLRHGPRKAHVFCLLDKSLDKRPINSGYYTYLSAITKGACLTLTDKRPHSIAQVTVDVLLAWMGTQKAGAETSLIPAKLMRYKSGQDIKQIKDEKDPVANRFFYAHRQTSSVLQHNANSAEEKRLTEQMQDNLAEILLDSDLLKKYLPKRNTPVANFADRYATDVHYKQLVVDQLKAIIESDVTSMSLNPVFGSLWRAVCSDRENPARDELIAAFGLHVDMIAKEDEKARMKSWLEGSYDHAADILETLNAVPDADRYPCVFLDPTIEFARPSNKGDANEDDGDEDDRHLTMLRRDELLEIGRSCDGRILRRLGKVLTRLTYVESASDLPMHIAETTDAQVPKIPLILASTTYKREFWKILLHTILPGTKLAARPATLLAALSIRIGMKPLFQSASIAMLFWRDKWNDLEAPETWNSSCLGLLLDADVEYQKQIKSEVSSKTHKLLLDSDRELFTRLVTYQHAGANLLTTLSAEVGWQPEKTQMPIGTVVMCRGCDLPRSVTIMAAKSGGKCGLCVANDWRDPDHKKRALSAHVTKEDSHMSKATWVECSIRTCRAQYVCYNPSELNVRPKCHYCRLQTSLSESRRSKDPVPILECQACLSKIIWPKEWRGIAPAPFTCIACVTGRKTIVSVDTTAAHICTENGQAWLLRNTENTIQEPFKRSVFHTISKVGPEAFLANVEVLPNFETNLNLTLYGKRIRNQDALIAELKSWIERRTAERSLCSLCFSTFPKIRLMPACRRHGCNQQICEGCLNGWYGLNKAGSIINTAALFCPFCRRPPAARTLAAYGMGIHAVSDLRKAIEERGQWIHVWCCGCGKSCQYMERQCARGAPDAVEDWKCESCTLSLLERARIAEEEARQTLALVERLTAEAQHEARDAAQRRLQEAQSKRTALMIPTKECPGCKIASQKVDGCDHMTCPLLVCGTHWCWSCGEGFDEDVIYDHMNDVHGSMYI